MGKKNITKVDDQMDTINKKISDNLTNGRMVYSSNISGYIGDSTPSAGVTWIDPSWDQYNQQNTDTIFYTW